jgi:hypothetical protein
MFSALQFRRIAQRSLRSASLWGLAVLLATVSGCQRGMMPTPVLFADGGVNPFHQVAPGDQNRDVPVFYATNCQPSGRQSLSGDQGFYTDERDFVLRVGQATVRLGSEAQTRQQLQQRSLESKNVPMRLVAIDEYGVLWTSVPHPQLSFDPDYVPQAPRQPAERFIKTINGQMVGDRKQIFIWVHGFDTTIHMNLQRIAEFRHFFGDAGAFIAYLWPSEHELTEYNEDKDHATFSVRSFRLLLEFLAAHTQVDEINILAHSAGSPIVVQTLRHMRLRSHHLAPAIVQEQTKIGHVVLAAPDMDLSEFINASLDGWFQVAEYVNIYTSPRDKALEMSEEIWEGTRLGSVEEATPLERLSLSRDTIATIDVGATPTGFLGHSYYRGDPMVSSDVLLALKFGLPAEQRGLVRRESDSYWEFPEDYGERVKQIGRDLYRQRSREDD